MQSGARDHWKSIVMRDGENQSPSNRARLSSITVAACRPSRRSIDARRVAGLGHPAHKEHNPMTEHITNRRVPRDTRPAQRTPAASAVPPGMGLALAPLRLFLGGTFTYAGLQKLTDPQFFDPGAAGYIGRQIADMAAGSPLQGVLLAAAVPHATLFGFLVAWGELAIGLGTLIGLFLRAAALGGTFLSLVFFLTASWQVRPYFYGADSIYACAWLTLLLAGSARTGLPALDTLLGGQRTVATPPAAWATTGTRRQFLWGLVTGVGGVLAILFFRRQTAGVPAGGQSGQLPAEPTAPPAALAPTTQAIAATAAPVTPTAGASAVPVPSSSPTVAATHPPLAAVPTPPSTTVPPPTATSPAHGPAIAQVAQVPANSAMSFGVPGSRAQGVLVHLADGRFVAFDAACTHAGCPVRYDPTTKLLFCPCHGAEFDPANGAAVVRRPARTPLAVVPIQLDQATGAITLGS
jgi:thiosulfate dehydrogenase [quinone] large subunit